MDAEPGVDPAALDALEQSGWTVRRWEERNLFFGGVQAVAPTRKRRAHRRGRSAPRGRRGQRRLGAVRGRREPRGGAPGGRLARRARSGAWPRRRGGGSAATAASTSCRPAPASARRAPGARARRLDPQRPAGQPHRDAREQRAAEREHVGARARRGTSRARRRPTRPTSSRRRRCPACPPARGRRARAAPARTTLWARRGGRASRRATACRGSARCPGRRSGESGPR